LNILRLDHAALLVKDVERSRQFYCQVLGMEIIPGLGAVWLAKGSAEIHLLGESEQGRAAQASGTYYDDDLADGHTPHIAFEIEDLEEAQRHLKEHDVEIVCGPRPRGNDGEQLYVRDPDGYVIELFARRGVAPKKRFAHREVEQ
jgi:catechol 2,3-dioxygenase-like lactoylglutathione lyase family enzyme